ncbi:murein hydrolase activator EnvC family protein [Hyphomicrobium sp.]|uniref:murein hydrolase activator EnvC family protein n=1 Tax=Hyphomicrobium sp. TaxID=82 RepID=UPI002D796D1D|nr:peptidoglycan DD-metalloendopeptidase family protein [Hyphomicrobium sp.]HET6387743.1 peptidoglycan DD-metalloendopeptidase family protein [Hyphomicrobium sp.]
MFKNLLSSRTSRLRSNSVVHRALAGVLLLSAAIVPLHLTAQEKLPSDPTAARKVLEEKKRELDANAAQELRIQSDVSELSAERERLNSRLLETAALIQRSEGQMTSIEGRLSELEEQERVLQGSLAQRHGQISGLLAALQRMGRNPPPVLVTAREDALGMVRSAMLLSSAYPDLRDKATTLGTKLADLQRVMGNIRTEGARLQAETDRLNEARTRLASLMEAKKATLADRQSELQSVRVATADITKSVTNLSELINRLDTTVTQQTGLGAYNEELKARQPAGATQGQPKAGGPQIITPPPPAQDAELPKASGAIATLASSQAPATGLIPAALSAAKTPTPEATKPASGNTKLAMVELEPGGGSLVPGSPGRIKPAIPFSEAKGKLPLPAQGRRALKFGEKTQFGGQSKGIVIETRPSAQVTSPSDGWVVYAGEFRSYGQLLIINAGDGYHILLAGLSQIDVQPGQFVLSAEPVGTMSGGQKASTAAPVSGPVLYVELRKDGRPIDPDPWWASGQQKVQG